MFIREYMGDISMVDSAEQFRDIYNMLPDYRKLKIDALKLLADKKRSLMAGYLLRGALSEFGLSDSDVCFNSHGKPILRDAGLFFSISHSGDKAFVVLSDHEIGCDVEMIRDIDAIRLAQRFFAPEEVSYLTASADIEGEFFRIWTLKEAYIKCRGEGLSIPLNSFIVCPDKLAIWDDAFVVRKSCIDGGYAFGIIARRD